MKLRRAQAIVDGALAEARRRGTSALAVMVLDAGGHPVAFAREDGASFFRLDIARAKATGALGMGTDTRALSERAKGNPLFFSSLSVTVGGSIAYSPGGVLVRDATGSIIGAVGISGDTGDADESCALAGMEAARLPHGVDE